MDGVKLFVQPQYALILLSLACALIAAVSGVIYLGSVVWHTERSVYYFARATHPANGVSPATPMVLVVALVYLWSLAHLRRLTAVSGASIKTSLEHLKPLAGDALTKPAGHLEKFIDGAVQGLPPPLTTAVLAAACVATYLALRIRFRAQSLDLYIPSAPRGCSCKSCSGWRSHTWAISAQAAPGDARVRRHADDRCVQAPVARVLSRSSVAAPARRRRHAANDADRPQLGLALDEAKDTKHAALRDALLGAVAGPDRPKQVIRGMRPGRKTEANSGPPAPSG
jgi:hypothetical protein